MGIDIYARWRGMSDEALKAQLAAGFSTTSGAVGYLREAYHGEPYATHHLVPEAFASEVHAASIPSALLTERLPETLRLAEARERGIYRETDAAHIQNVLQSFRDFVSLCAAMEEKHGEPVRIIASY